MAALRDLLEVYGALDEAAAQSGNPAVAATLDEFLPGSSANTGWYLEVEKFFFGDQARRSPNMGQACARLGLRAEQAEQGNGRPLSAPQKQRLFYGLTCAARIQRVAPTPMLSPVSTSDLMSALVPALAAAGPEDTSYEERCANVENRFGDFLNQAESANRANYNGVRRATAADEMRILDPSTLQIPLCRSWLVKVDGLRAAVIDTDLSSDGITLNNLVAIANPFNWKDNYPDFFQRMAGFRPFFRDDEWRRVLETVGFGELGAFELTTALKYHTKVRDGEARLDYDLDDPTPGPGDGQVLVDRGYINMWAKNEENDADAVGVRVRTRKVIHISGLSPFAQQRLVCLTGYGTASSEFLFGPAAEPNPEAREFGYYSPEQEPEEEPATSDSGPSTHVVATAVNLWTDSVQGLVNDYFEVAEKWMGGGLRLGDVTEFSQKVTGRLVSSPLEFLERVNQPRYRRGRPRATQPGQPNEKQQGGAQ